VCSGPASETVAFHGTCEAASFGPAADIHYFAGFEYIHGNQLSDFVVRGVTGAHFLEPAADLVAFQVSGFGFVGATHSAETELHGLVTILFDGANLRHRARSGLNDGDWNDLPSLVKQLGHADFFPRNALTIFFACISLVFFGPLSPARKPKQII
jgi:hypothetical protein